MSDRDVALPERRDDGTWKYPLQVILQTWGRWETGHARFETVGYASDLAHVKRLLECLR